MRPYKKLEIPTSKACPNRINPGMTSSPGKIKGAIPPRIENTAPVNSALLKIDVLVYLPIIIATPMNRRALKN
jgi:hypothetical protein